MKKYSDFESAIRGTKERLLTLGREVKQENWQSKPSPDDTHELLNESFQVMGIERDKLVEEIRPTLPWADKHFEERVGGKPLNPPPSHNDWPFGSKGNIDFTDVFGKFDHTYPERLWPQHAGVEAKKWEKGTPQVGEYQGNTGIRFRYGDLDDVVMLLKNDPSTRQAFIPIWFPEDTGARMGIRVPCTLGYHVIQRSEFLHMVYYIRSCDVVRHFRNDVYMAVKLLYWLIDRVTPLGNPLRGQWKAGTFTMHITSLHCFAREKFMINK